MYFVLSVVAIKTNKILIAIDIFFNNYNVNTLTAKMYVKKKRIFLLQNNDYKKKQLKLLEKVVTLQYFIRNCDFKLFYIL